MATTLYRRDEVLTDFMGHPLSGVKVFVCSQPANTSSIPPSPLAPIYADPAGAELLAAPPQTDQNGHAEFYAAPGLYTLVLYSTQIATPSQTLVLPDQVISGPAPIPPSYNSDSTANGTITPNPDGVQTEFNLSSIPVTNSLLFMINGLVATGYTILPGLLTVVLPVAPHAGSLLTATYQTA